MEWIPIPAATSAARIAETSYNTSGGMAHCAQCTADTFNLLIVGSIGSTGLEPYYPIIPEWLDKSR